MKQNSFNVRRQDFGGTSVLAMTMILGLSVVGMAAVAMTSSQHKNVDMSGQKQSANSLAESGIRVLYDRIRNQMIAEEKYPSTLAETTASIIDGGQTVTIGTYSAKVVSLEEKQNDTGQTAGSRRQRLFTITLEGTGKTPSGALSVLRTTFTAIIERQLVERIVTVQSAQPPQAFFFPAGALVSNDTVEMVTNQGIRTYAPNGRDAHIIANEGISWNSASGNKNDYSNPNIIDIQGQYLVPQGGVYQRTIGPGWLGNANGKKNYRNPAAPAAGSFPGSPADSVLAMPSPVSFADEKTVEGWAATWKTRATVTGSTKWVGTTGTANVPKRTGDQWQIIQSPAYIDGDLLVENGRQLRLMPRSDAPADNVIYVRGNVKNMGQLLNLGVTLVFEGKYSDDRDAEYKIDTQGSLFGTREKVLTRANLVSLNRSRDAISFTTNSSATTGLVYSTLGGISITGTPEFTGSLVAGGGPGRGGIKIAPANGNSFVLHYDPYSATGGSAPASQPIVQKTIEPGNIVTPFTPSKPFNWVALK